MDENESQNKKPSSQEHEEVIKSIHKQMDELEAYNRAQNTKRKVMSILTKIGIVLIVVIGIPIILFGTCILFIKVSMH